jgi:hypothetical protein
MPSIDVSQGSFFVPNMLKVRLRVATCLGLLDDSTGCVFVRMNESYQAPSVLPRRRELPTGSRSNSCRGRDWL